MVKSAAMVTEALARAKGLTLTVKVAEGMPVSRGDERRLTQVLINLLGNAVKFTESGSVQVIALAVDGQLEISVSDTGPGIAPEHHVRIFEEFQQVDDSNTRRKGGSGLGLAISRRIVEMHGGSISLHSTLGVGSIFTITLPVKAPERETVT
jgi:signal transduction histidine kinase